VLTFGLAGGLQGPAEGGRRLLLVLLFSMHGLLPQQLGAAWLQLQQLADSLRPLLKVCQSRRAPATLLNKAAPGGPRPQLQAQARQLCAVITGLKPRLR
jgi:hypothetical protein